MEPDRRLHSTEVGGVGGAPARAELDQRVASIGHRCVDGQHQEHGCRRAAVATCQGHRDVGGDDDLSFAIRWKLFHDRPHQTLRLLRVPAHRKCEHVAARYVRQDRKILVHLGCVGGRLLLEWERTDVDAEG